MTRFRGVVLKGKTKVRTFQKFAYGEAAAATAAIRVARARRIKDVSCVLFANVLCENRRLRRVGVVNTSTGDLLKTFERRRSRGGLSSYGETEVRVPRGERSYVSAPNKNSFDIQIASAFFRRVVFVQGNRADFASGGFYLSHSLYLSLYRRKENL